MSTLMPMVAVRPPQTWIERATFLWQRRIVLCRFALISFVLSLGIAFLLPKQYKSSTSIMPPSSGGMSTAMLAALSGKALGGLGGLGSLAGSLFGMSNSTALYVELLQSGTVNGRIVDRFDLQHVYRKRYRIDTLKALARRVDMRDDKRSGVITITVEDHDPVRARDMAAAYLDELNQLLNHTSASTARQERVFVGQRLQQAKIDLSKAQESLSEFSSTHSTIDLKEQARAEVTSAAAIQAQVLVEEANISSLRQIYGDGNVRLRAAEARATSLRSQLSKLSGTSAPLDDSTEQTYGGITPPLRQLPRLAVPFADRYRDLQIQEKLFELLTEQYEMARISEAKDTPVISVIDYPGVAEKKSFPPRLLLAIGLSMFAMLVACVSLIAQESLRAIPHDDERRQFVMLVVSSFQKRLGRAS